MAALAFTAARALMAVAAAPTAVMDAEMLPDSSSADAAALALAAAAATAVALAGGEEPGAGTWSGGNGDKQMSNGAACTYEH